MAAPFARPRRPVPTTRPDIAEPRVRRLVLIAAVALMMLAGALGWILGGILHESGTTPRAIADRVVEAGGTRVLVDGGWTPVSAGKALAATPGLTGVAAFAPIAGLSGRAWIARAPLDGPSLLPAGLRARVTRLPAPAKVRLAGHPAWLYEAAPLRSGDLLEVTALPTATGVLLVGCEASRTAWSTVAKCAGDVHGVGVGATLPPSSTLAFRERFKPVIAKLDAGRVAAAGALRRAGHARGQRLAARQLAAAHAAAAATLSPLAPATGPQRQAVKQLKSSAAAYGALARAAGQRNRRAYGRARAAALRSDKALTAALAGAAR
jgi:hypothetical protein